MEDARGSVRIMSGSNGVNMIEVTVLQAAFRQLFLNRASALPSLCR